MSAERQTTISAEEAIATILKFVDEDEIPDCEVDDDDDFDVNLDEILSDEGEKQHNYHIKFNA